MKLSIRQIQGKDLDIRVKWMNRHEIYDNMHYATPVSIDGQNAWFHIVIKDPSRFDCVFENAKHEVVAMGGLTHINAQVKKAELYIFVDPDAQHKGYGTQATNLLCKYGFEKLGLHKIYLYTNESNISARRIYEKTGFKLEGRMRDERALGINSYEDRLYYGIIPHDVAVKHDIVTIASKEVVVQQVEIEGLGISVVRDDLYPEVGGAGKARKAVYYESYLKEHGYNAVVTCGGVQSNHNRAIALMCARNGWKCHLCIQGTEERFMSEKGNALLDRLSGAEIEFLSPEETSEAMDRAMEKFTADGYKPFYCHGGGHDLPGGVAYVDAMEELAKKIEKPDYIFLASGTGSTQAGIIVGLELLGWGDVKCIGISIAREQKRGRKAVADFTDVLASHYDIQENLDNKVLFNTDYLFGGYEQFTKAMVEYLNHVMVYTGIMFDTTYSGKAFYGMMDYIKRNQIQDKRIVFWHTGGLMNLMK